METMTEVKERPIRHWKSGRKSMGGRKEAQKRYRAKNREKRSAKGKEWYARNRDREKVKRRAYQIKNKDAVYAANRQWQRSRAKNLKAEMIEAYGGKCCCCGEPEFLFLQLDHIYNDGNIERRKFGNHIVEWAYLKSIGWPKDRHQLLCANCNYGKRVNKGACPHKTKQLNAN